ncbi:hypothetical protein B9Z55_021628 [Caenorhabditis nigoni]|uniref:Uncharacterized protein n=1 Tax=Caenorhabditis nigoni TaxID=1611254 RepID=A0A2G5TTR3_9PELO|nr:hypothetical protein B9Z55_021628 [Caenorhabditis nigoni]
MDYKFHKKPKKTLIKQKAICEGDDCLAVVLKVSMKIHRKSGKKFCRSCYEKLRKKQEQEEQEEPKVEIEKIEEISPIQQIQQETAIFKIFSKPMENLISKNSSNLASAIFPPLEKQPISEDVVPEDVFLEGLKSFMAMENDLEKSKKSLEIPKNAEKSRTSGIPKKSKYRSEVQVPEKATTPKTPKNPIEHLSALVTGIGNQITPYLNFWDPRSSAFQIFHPPHGKVYGKWMKIPKKRRTSKKDIKNFLDF